MAAYPLPHCLIPAYTHTCFIAHLFSSVLYMYLLLFVDCRIRRTIGGKLIYTECAPLSHARIWHLLQDLWKIHTVSPWLISVTVTNTLRLHSIEIYLINTILKDKCKQYSLSTVFSLIWEGPFFNSLRHALSNVILYTCIHQILRINFT